MARKTDYAKGLSAGAALLKRMPARYREYRHNYRTEIEAMVRKAEEKYSESIGNTPCPVTGEVSMRSWFYRDGILDAIYNQDTVNRWVVCRFNGCGHYTVESLAEETLHDDPVFAWKRAWELDPHGHDYTSKPIRYVNGACAHFGIAVC